MKLSVIGLGHLGLPMASIFASRGYDVIGLDANKWLVEQIQKGNCPIHETKLDELMASTDNRLQATTDYEEATLNSDISFIMVPTPTDKTDGFSNDYVLSVIRGIGATIKVKQNYHIVVVTSTVMPGTMANVIKPELEKITGKQCGLDFGLCYNPEFVALGDVIQGMSSPDAVLIGESDAYAGTILEKFYGGICTNNPPIIRTSWWNAELAKLSLNSFVTIKISLANTLAEMCDKMPTGDVDVITKFLGFDSRIGPKYLRGGLGYGGPCFPRDNKAFIAFAKQIDADSTIEASTDRFNRNYTEYVLLRVLHLLGIDDKTVSVLGLTYKPNTNVIEESVALEIAQQLSRGVANVKAYDPAGMENAKRELNDAVEYSKDIADCLRESDLCIIATPWRQFSELDSEAFAVMRKPKVLDCWRMLNKDQLQGVEYHALGVRDD